MPATISPLALLRPLQCLLLLVIATTVAAQSSADQEFTIDRLDWQKEMKPGSHLVVRNPWGDIRIRQTGGSTGLVHAVMQKIGEQPKVAELKVVSETDERVEIAFVYPEGEEPASFSEGRIDVAIMTPYGNTTEVHADRGRVITKTMEDKLTVRATDTALELKSKGPLDVETVAAPVVLQIVNGEAGDRGRIVTQRGNIEIRYYINEKVEFHMTSGASKTTNDLPLLRSRGRDGRSVTMSHGEDVARYTLQSDTGNIILNNLGGDLSAGDAD
ncbi:MAG: hypothetical protein Tsb002_28770 [Wenzhouxiangellaceae bacterium]